MDSVKLAEILQLHKRWLRGDGGGQRADLRGSDLSHSNLRGSDLSGSNLRGSNLRGSDLSHSNLSGSDLSGSDLRGSNLRDSNLRDSDLSHSDLRGSNLSGSDLSCSNLSGSNLRGSNLRGSNLGGSNLGGSNVSMTCLDPANQANQQHDEFKKRGKLKIGYRTRKAGHIDKYRDGWVYSADWFSTADTECHPGLYLWPTLEAAKNFSGGVEFIKVEFDPQHLHKAGPKYRVRWFRVIGEAK